MAWIRLCCGQEHSGPVCLDDKVMCCLCYEPVTQENLSVDPVDGKKWDVCIPCRENEKEQMRDMGLDDDVW